MADSLCFGIAISPASRDGFFPARDTTAQPPEVNALPAKKETAPKNGAVQKV
ncbi:hypothetical protein [Pseudodesulfovibrio methanolicus]|uniref:Uncharacterized protein n=1 Tax=Pseudodesulfovibrio methanolicus TaxID=3126690 RepID=A0ABZ2IYY0_9BACT